MSTEKQPSPEPPGKITGALEGGAWKAYCVKVGSHYWEGDEPPAEPGMHRKHIEPWLAALLQAEHLNLLLGNGITTAVATLAKASAPDMDSNPFPCRFAEAVAKAAKEGASRSGRGEPNLEDQVRAACDLIGGLRILAKDEGEDGRGIGDRARDLLAEWEAALDDRLCSLLKSILQAERGIADALAAQSAEADRIRTALCSFLLAFACRTATRERLHIFTTNYDRIVEYACDLLGLRVLDRFVGRLTPVFRASRLGIDFHYNPPGIRGEPRYLEGVVRLTKLHGSIDWRQEKMGAGGSRIVRAALPFAASDHHSALPENPGDGLIVYPNPAKDVETLGYPYAELFRDFATAVCQPNAVMVTYGYGFGDDHINRVLQDMLTIPSTHLAIISYDRASGRIERFVEATGREEQITLLLGTHFGDLETLVEHYLPKPAIDRTTWRMVDLLDRRTPHAAEEPKSAPEEPETGPGESETGGAV